MEKILVSLRILWEETSYRYNFQNDKGNVEHGSDQTENIKVWVSTLDLNPDRTDASPLGHGGCKNRGKRMPDQDWSSAVTSTGKRLECCRRKILGDLLSWKTWKTDTSDRQGLDLGQSSTLQCRQHSTVHFFW